MPGMVEYVNKNYEISLLDIILDVNFYVPFVTMIIIFVVIIIKKK